MITDHVMAIEWLSKSAEIGANRSKIRRALAATSALRNSISNIIKFDSAEASQLNLDQNALLKLDALEAQLGELLAQ